MTGDTCECGICAIDVCDICSEPVAFVDAESEAWCAACYDNYQQMQAEQAAERDLASWHGGNDWMGDGAYRRAMRLTRQEQLEGLADRGIDTWAEYRGER
jgi:hypothetical protein